MRFVIGAFIACGLCLAPLGAAQAPPPPQAAAQPYKAPRNAFGQPSFDGIWTHNFLIVMEASPQAPMLTLPEPAAKAMAGQVAGIISKQLDSALDPEVPELMKVIDGLPIVKGERRTRSVIEPADGKLPYSP